MRLNTSNYNKGIEAISLAELSQGEQLVQEEFSRLETAAVKWHDILSFDYNSFLKKKTSEEEKKYTLDKLFHFSWKCLKAVQSLMCFQCFKMGCVLKKNPQKLSEKRLSTWLYLVAELGIFIWRNAKFTNSSGDTVLLWLKNVPIATKCKAEKCLVFNRVSYLCYIFFFSNSETLYTFLLP